MSKLSLLLTSFMTMLLLCGCPSSYFSAQVLEVGYKEYYADLSRIEKNTVYELDGKNYIKAPVLQYNMQTHWYAARPGAETNYIKTAELPARVIEIDDNTKNFLCKKNFWDEKYLPYTSLDGTLSKLEQLPPYAVKYPAVNLPGKPQIAYNAWGNSFLDKTIYLDYSCDWTTFAVMPLLLLTVPIDITATVTMTAFHLITMPAVELYHYSLRL